MIEFRRGARHPTRTFSACDQAPGIGGEWDDAPPSDHARPGASGRHFVQALRPSRAYRAAPPAARISGHAARATQSAYPAMNVRLGMPKMPGPVAPA